MLQAGPDQVRFGSPRKLWHNDLLHGPAGNRPSNWSTAIPTVSRWRRYKAPWKWLASPVPCAMSTPVEPVVNLHRWKPGRKSGSCAIGITTGPWRWSNSFSRISTKSTGCAQVAAGPAPRHSISAGIAARTGKRGDRGQKTRRRAGFSFTPMARELAATPLTDCRPP